MCLVAGSDRQRKERKPRGRGDEDTHLSLSHTERKHTTRHGLQRHPQKNKEKVHGRIMIALRSRIISNKTSKERGPVIPKYTTRAAHPHHTSPPLTHTHAHTRSHAHARSGAERLLSWRAAGPWGSHGQCGRPRGTSSRSSRRAPEGSRGRGGRSGRSCSRC